MYLRLEQNNLVKIKSEAEGVYLLNNIYTVSILHLFIYREIGHENHYNGGKAKIGR
jgi:hypothetical protein